MLGTNHSAGSNFAACIILGVLSVSALGLCSPLPRSVGERKGEQQLGSMMSKYVRQLQQLRSEVAIARRIAISTLNEGDGNVTCIDYPYQPSSADAGRLTDHVITLRDLQPLARSIAEFEANDQNSSSPSSASVSSPLVNRTVNSLRETVESFVDVAKALSQEYNSTTTQSAGNPGCFEVSTRLQGHQALVELYIAVTYAAKDAVALSNFYNTPT